MHRLYGAWCYISSLFVLVVIVNWLVRRIILIQFPLRLQRYKLLRNYTTSLINYSMFISQDSISYVISFASAIL